MIPTKEEIKKMWDTYAVPEQKRVHMEFVARVASFLGAKLTQETINLALLQAAALVHDIDKAVPKLPGERHPDTAVRILKAEGMDEVAGVVATHSLHMILDPGHTPKTWEQKLLFLADKMVKYDIVGVDKRFDLWRKEQLPQEAQKILDESYPKVKELEQEVFTLAGVSLTDVAKLA